MLGRGDMRATEILVDQQRLLPPVGRGCAALRQPRLDGAVRTSDFRPSMRRSLLGANGRSTTICIGCAGPGPQEFEDPATLLADSWGKCTRRVEGEDLSPENNEDRHRQLQPHEGEHRGHRPW